ncbi:MAG TPA: FtsH protease activity modulator HflK [Candidatus Polarisedimenticolia bacterium]|jgi:membrane protease subunit HflK|nr:FtsH protease activity modulator HflK [Candidatus Polarisedimenticolia bacterium]
MSHHDDHPDRDAGRDHEAGRDVLGALRGYLPALVWTAALAVLGLLAFMTSWYQVEPDEVAVVQRFGAYVRTADPGLHMKIPLFVERVTKVPIRRQLKMEFGFRTVRPGVQSTFAPPTPETRAESLMLTGDLNVAEVEWSVQYRITDPRRYLFDVRDVPRTFRDMSQAAMRQVVGDHSVDEVITIGREAIALEAKQELQRLCNLYGIGIEVQQLVLQDVNPPDAVKPAFNEVNQAIQEKERAINDAWAEYNRTVPLAKGQAEQAVRSAEGYAQERVNNAEGDADRFVAIQAEYARAPQVTRRRLYLEAMTDILPKAGRRIVVDEKARGILPLLNLTDTGEKK